jgi:hypothetical protein
MSVESLILLDTTSVESQDLSVYSYSDKRKGAGYFRKAAGIQTILFRLDNFKGSIKIQGTLELYPGDRDWIDLEYDQGNSLESLDSTALTTNEIRNITGNWVWIRAAWVLEQGTITEIRYNL